MSVTESRIVHRELVAADTLACVVARPEEFQFRPGQYVDVTLVSPPFTDDLGWTRAMSIASAPSDDDLLFLMRLRGSAFKRSITALPIGAPVLLDGPADDLGLRCDDGRHVVMIAGGVGIAPFRSMLREAVRNDVPLDGTVFYSNRRVEDAAYLGELEALVSARPRLRLVPTMTRMAESSLVWAGETERLSAAMLARHLPGLAGPRYYISGSTLLISAMCQELENAGVPGGDIRIEMYTGY